MAATNETSTHSGDGGDGKANELSAQVQPPTAKKQDRAGAGRRQRVRGMLRGVSHLLVQLGCGIANWRRRLLRKKLADYPVILLDHAISERAPHVPWWYAYLPNLKLPLSLEYLHNALERVAGDPDVRGVVLLMKGPSLTLSQAQSLAQLFARFRSWDAEWCTPDTAQQERSPKEIIVHLEQASAAVYIAAAAADRVTMTPLSSWDVVGLRVARTYWKELLDKAGVAFDVIKIAPWKTAADPYIHTDMSEAEREQFDWLLDSLIEDITSAIAQGRNLPPEQVRTLIDRAPLTAQQALDAGLIDAIAYEDQLSTLLSQQPAPGEPFTPQRLDAAQQTTNPSTTDPSAEEQAVEEHITEEQRAGEQTEDDSPPADVASGAEKVSSGEVSSDEVSSGEVKPVTLKPFSHVRGLLLRRPRRRPEKRVGVLSLEGAIIVGESRSFPFPLPLLGEKVIGSKSVEQQIRAARKDNSLGAVVVYIDSGGGSALASDLIWRELTLLNQEKPVVVYMGNVAGSGGYYVAVPGRKIVAQPATLTGSIGVVVAKGVTTELRTRLGANRAVIRRGDNAGLYSDDAHWNESQQELMREAVEHIYATFKERVAEGRSLPYASLDEIANGRVWTAKQAQDHGLVDELGDFTAALHAACAAAGLPTDGTTATKIITPPRTRLPATAGQPGQAVRSQLNANEMHGWLQALLQGEWLHLLQRDRFWLLDIDQWRIE